MSIMTKSTMKPNLEFSSTGGSDSIERLFFLHDIRRPVLNFEYQLLPVIMFFFKSEIYRL